MPSFDPQSIVLATLGASLLLFVTDALRYDLIAVLVVLVLAATNVLEPHEAFAGFSSPAIVLIASMYVFGQAMTRWGVAELIGQKLLFGPSRSEARTALRVSFVAGALSSVLSNTGVVATLIPVLGVLSRQQRIPISRLLIPLAFGSLLGGTLTVVGTSTNIAVNEAIREQGGEPFGLFEFTHLGIVFLVLGSLYFLTPFHRLLPRSREGESLSEHYQLPKYVTEVLVEPSSTLINRTVAEADLFERYGISVLGIVRSGEASALAPGPYNRVRTDDTLILQGEPENLVRLRRELGLKERKSVQVGDQRLTAADVQLVEAVVPTGSTFVGHTLVETDFHASTNLNVLAISKHGDVQPRSIGKIPLEVGDSLLIQGHEPDIERMRRSRELLVLDEIELQSFGRGALITVLTLVGVLVLAATKLMALSVAALGGAVVLVLTGTVRPHEARRAIDWSVLVLIGGMLSLGVAFDRHGLGREVAHWIAGLGSESHGPHVLLAVLLLATTALNQALNHVATAVIMTPVALAFPHELGISDRPMLMAVLVGANMCFLTPVSHQVNAMVMGPGDYRYTDFFKIGLPLTLMLCAVAIVLIPIFWPLVP